jgi:hypothetical protein
MSRVVGARGITGNQAKSEGNMDKVNMESIAAKIRALLAKTTDNGCSEDEAIAAMSKAGELMAKYQIDLTETELRAEPLEKCFVDPRGRHADMARNYLGPAVGKFTDTRVWNTYVSQGKKKTVFLGLKSDALFAQWLMESLLDFIMRGADIAKKADKSIDKKSFALGAAIRIREKLWEIVKARKQETTASGNSTALVLQTKQQMIAAYLAAEGLKFQKARGGSRSYDGASYSAGQSYGNGASFGRPMSGASGVLRIARG